MKNSLAVAGAALVALCAGAPSFATTTVYTSTLTGASEVPANASPGVGLAILTLDDTSFSMRLQTVFFGLLGTVSAAHIHCCTAVPVAGTAGVVTQLPTFVGFPLGGTSGAYDATFDMTLSSSWNGSYVTANGGTPSSAFAALSSGLNSGRGYLNIHSTSFGGGEIRGFLLPAVPEPASYALMLAGLAVVGWAARQQRRVA